MSDAPKVLHVLAPMREGGLERVVAMMAVERTAGAVHVAAIVEPAFAAQHPFATQLEALGVKVERVRVGRKNYLREYTSLKRVVRQVRPGVVHTHGYRADVIGAAVARAHRIPTVSTVHGFTGGGWRNRFYEWLQCLALRRADAVIAVSAPLVARLKERGVDEHRIHCVRTGFSPLAANLSRAAARQRLQLNPDTLVVGWVGRLSREKGADVMLEALSKADPRWNLSVIGSGDEIDRLKAQAEGLGISDRVTWHGSMQDAGGLMSAFDAFVLSSRTEGTPITLFEAMHAKVPIIATRVGGVPDIIDASQGILVDSEDPDKIADALDTVASEPTESASRARAAYDRLVGVFGTAAWLERIEAIYRAVSGNSRETGTF